jgi:hypothetical protein
LIRRSGHPQVEPFGYFDVFHRLATPFLYDGKKIPRTISPFVALSQRAAAKSTLKNPRRKYAKRTTRPTTQNDDGRRRIGQARRKLGRTIREIVRAVERPKLTVYPIKFKRYFNIVQQEPRKLLPFRAFFYIFARKQRCPICLFYANYYFFRRLRDGVFPTVSRLPPEPRRRLDDARLAAALAKTNPFLF